MSERTIFMVALDFGDLRDRSAYLDEACAGETLDGRDHPGLKRESGHIGFLGHGSIVEFRKIRIKEF